MDDDRRDDRPDPVADAAPAVEPLATAPNQPAGGDPSMAASAADDTTTDPAADGSTIDASADGTPRHASAGGEREDGGGRHSDDRDDKKKGGSFWKELPILIVVALGLALLIKAFLLQAFYIPSASMEPTLHGCTGCTGDRVLVNKLIYNIRSVHRGEIVVFKGPPDWPSEVSVAPPGNPVSAFFRDIGGALGIGPGNGTDFIKRVIGVGGDHVKCCNAQGRVTVNGVALHEHSYLYPGNPPSKIEFSITVPKHTVFVMGDHRSDSSDSRYHLSDPRHGAIPVDDVVGKAFVRVWPPSRWGGLGVPGTFQQSKLDSSDHG
jgi:signal peptidase I